MKLVSFYVFLNENGKPVTIILELESELEHDTSVGVVTLEEITTSYISLSTALRDIPTFPNPKMKDRQYLL